MKQEQISSESLLTSYQVGELLQVNPSSVNKWVKDGRIPAFRTPGGHHRIRAGDLVIFLHNHRMPVPRPLANAGRKRLLVVDDDPKQLKALRRTLKPHARYVNMVDSGDGIDALIQIGAFKPHLVILDFNMPSLDGIEVVKRLKALPDTQDTKIALVSGQLTNAIEKRAKAAGVDHCYAKPLDPETILDMLEIPREVTFEL